MKFVWEALRRKAAFSGLLIFYGEHLYREKVATQRRPLLKKGRRHSNID
jgi:hypothetical protein